MRSRDAEDSVLSISDFSLQSALVYNSQFFPMSIGGTTTTSVNPAALPVTNPAGVYIPANAELTIKTGAIVSLLGYIPGGLSQTVRTKKVGSTDIASQIFSRFDINNNTGRVDTTLGLFPVMVTGIPAKRHVAIAGWGDSLMAGVGDVTNNSNGCMGWFEHACHAVDGASRNIPFTNLSKSGDMTSTYSVDEAQARFAYLEYATCDLRHGQQRHHEWSHTCTDARVASRSMGARQAIWVQGRRSHPYATHHINRQLGNGRQSNTCVWLHHSRHSRTV